MAQSKRKTLDDLEIAAIVDNALGQSVGFSQSKLSREREKVQQYYDGERPFRAHHGDASYISLDVYDSVESMTAQLLEVFSANNHPVSFVPTNGEDVVSAQVRTDYCTDVIWNQNDGFLNLQQTIRNGLIGRNAVVKVFWEEKKVTRYYHLSEPSAEEMTGHLMDHPEAEVTDLELREDGLGVKRATLKVPRVEGRIRIIPLDPEEFGISAMARDVDTATLVYHKHEMTASALIKEGYDPKVVARLQANDRLWMSTDTERVSRFQETDDIMANRTTAVNQDANRVCLVYECYLELDIDGSGESQLYKITKVGTEILDKEPVDRKPFVIFCPLPRPGAFWGHNFGKMLMHTQVARTYLTRSIINHALTTNNPRTMVVKGSVLNPRELMENKFGGIVNVTRPDGVLPMPQSGLNPFVFQTIQLLDHDKEEITGISQLSQGLNKDAISKQNSQGMVQELISVSQVRQKVIARNTAEFIRRLYMEVYRLTVENEDRQKIIRVAGSWVPVDFTQWPEDCEMEVSFSLGYGEQEKEAQKWAGVHAALSQIPGLAPYYSPEEQHTVATRALQAAGIKDTGSVLRPLDKPVQPPPNPMMMAEIAMKQADAEVKKANAQAAVAGLQMEQQKLQAEHQLAMAKLALETAKVQAALQLKQDQLAHKVAVDAAEIALEQQVQETAAKSSITAVAAPTR